MDRGNWARDADDTIIWSWSSRVFTQPQASPSISVSQSNEDILANGFFLLELNTIPKFKVKIQKLKIDENNFISLFSRASSNVLQQLGALLFCISENVSTMVLLFSLQDQKANAFLWWRVAKTASISSQARRFLAWEMACGKLQQKLEPVGPAFFTMRRSKARHFSVFGIHFAAKGKVHYKEIINAYSKLNIL